MRLKDLQTLVSLSTASDWHLVDHRLPGDRYAPGNMDRGFAKSASLRSNVAVTIRWGASFDTIQIRNMADLPTWLKRLDEDDRWSSIGWADLLYHGQVIHREYLINTNAGYLPCPYGLLHGNTGEPTTVTAFQVTFARLAAELEGTTAAPLPAEIRLAPPDETHIAART